MCRSYSSRDRSRDTDREESPSPEQEPAEDVEILTDGGDEDE